MNGTALAEPSDTSIGRRSDPSSTGAVPFGSADDLEMLRRPPIQAWLSNWARDVSAGQWMIWMTAYGKRLGPSPERVESVPAAITVLEAVMLSAMIGRERIEDRLESPETPTAALPVDSESTGRAFLYEALELLDTYARYERNWDSYGAEAISPVAIRTARSLLAQVFAEFFHRAGERIRPFHISPLRNGGIQVDWRLPGVALEVEISPDGTLSYLLVKGRKPDREVEAARNTSRHDVVRIVGQAVAAS